MAELPIRCSERGKHFSADCAELSVKGRNGHDKFLAIADNGGGSVSIYPLKGLTGKVVALALAREFAGREAESLRMDNVTHFKNKEVQAVLSELDLRPIYSIPYKSNTNGLAERAIKIVKELITTNEGKFWDMLEALIRLQRWESRPKPRKDGLDAIKDTGLTDSLLLSAGDEVWVYCQEGKTAAGTRTNLGGTGVVVSVTGNVVTLEDGKPGQNPEREKGKTRSLNMKRGRNWK